LFLAKKLYDPERSMGLLPAWRDLWRLKYDDIVARRGKWERTPWWMFWRPRMRKLRHWTAMEHPMFEPTYEYGSVAAVAREALEEAFAPTEGSDTSGNPAVDY
jgi:hypothetical protein